MNTITHNKSQFVCENGHVELSKKKPTELCDKCGSEEWELRVESWPVLTETPKRMKQENQEITIHNGNDLCSDSPLSEGQGTDLETSMVGSRVGLCEDCDWPDPVREYVKNS